MFEGMRLAALRVFGSGCKKQNGHLAGLLAVPDALRPSHVPYSAVIAVSTYLATLPQRRRTAFKQDFCN